MKLAFSALVLWLAACAAAKRPFLTARQPVVVDGSGQPALDALSSFQSQVAALATSLDQLRSAVSLGGLTGFATDALSQALSALDADLSSMQQTTSSVSTALSSAGGTAGEADQGVAGALGG